MPMKNPFEMHRLKQLTDVDEDVYEGANEGATRFVRKDDVNVDMSPLLKVDTELVRRI